ncbi:Uncharacterised protein [Escherichia coli]|uniref:Uncharacterized protein n=1 Tax=Escherichia coli TaxID=562 RepID=A0A377HGB0_ECOLX|nr:Uncharacterised protein [Escherichia coli]
MSSKLYSVIGRFQGEQFAVGDKNIGHKRGQVTLLSAIDFDGSSFCGLFPADNELWLVIGVDKDGMVHFDKSFHSKDDAKNSFRPCGIWIPVGQNIQSFRCWSR